jgi:carbon monoxide dehydrogenase subunit G
MTTFEKTIIIPKPLTTVYDFLKDLSHHEPLMPDSIENWEATADRASFRIKNMTQLNLVVKSREENREIVAIPEGKTPINVQFKWSLLSAPNEYTQAIFTIEADLNMMMKMIASAPLQKLVDFQVNKLAQILAD